ncbi:MAG: agmatinase [Desulfonauticus sp.]|nr:agmatinase [Desulfonauticus sp.]
MDCLFDYPLSLKNNKKQIWVLPCPFEGSVSYGTGTQFGPKAIFEASKQIETFDPELNIALEDYLDFPILNAPPRNINSILDYLTTIERILTNYSPQQDFFLTLGGEHSITLPLIKFYHKAYKDLVVLQIDAHADLRESYEGSNFSHACVMARCLELNVTLIQIGIRSVCKEEWQTIKNNKNIHSFFSWQLKSAHETALECRKIIQNRPLYFTFDADGLDPSIMPGVGTPEPQGISFEWFKNFIFYLKPINLIGMDFCELAPMPHSVLSQSIAAKCIFKTFTTYVYYNFNLLPNKN